MNRLLIRGIWTGLSLITMGWLIYEHWFILRDGPYVRNVYFVPQITLPEYQLSLAAYFFSHLMMIRSFFDRVEKLEVTLMLWRLFLTGMGGILILLSIFFVYDNWMIGRMSSFMQRSTQATFFTIGIEVTVIFFFVALFTFRRFILYQKNKAKVRSWKMLLGFLVIALIFTNRSFLFNSLLGGAKPEIIRSVQVSVGILYAILLIYLSTNVRWIGFLNLNQKLRALGLLLLIISIGGTFLASLLYLPGTLQFHPETQELLLGPYIEPVFFLFLAAFTFIYSSGAILVLFFNLPTSSVFEQKRSEIASFNKINQSIQSNLDRKEVLKTSLEASILSSNAEAGWIDEVKEGKPSTTIISMLIGEDEVIALSGHYDLASRIIQSRQPALVKNTRRHKAFRASGSIYKSLLGLPVITDNKVRYVLFVVSTVSNAFEEETLSTLQAYGAQAGAAIENAARIQNAISLERYQEQLKIAKDMQEDLLPTSLPVSNGVSFSAVSETAEEVGGDYFDIFQADDNRYNIAIGDVSGKGTRAAFYMAEVKGMFQALCASNVSPLEFVTYANRAVNACFQPGYFVTLTYMHLDAKSGKAELVRAGHCPTMIYRAAKDEVDVLREGTLALGMVKEQSFKKHLGKPESIQLEPGDVVLLYTDGIIETRNDEGESYGFDRLKETLAQNARTNAPSLGETILQSVREFSEDQLHDDYTILIVSYSGDKKPNTN
jgi:sigma-B regulation protein RsbU (phosphoserine phosphatase)